jgi:hypothetical protein
MRDPGKSVEK